MMQVLERVAGLTLDDCWIGAGFVRNKVWDHLHGHEARTPLNDVDVIYFRPGDKSPESDKELERCLARGAPDIPWSVKNQARMHLVNGEAAYLSSADAISRWPETATAIGLSLDARGALRLLAPHGVEDLLGLKVVPTAHFRRSAARMQMFKRRLVGKRWAETWPKLEIFCG